jgi:hypothetical protein
LSPISGKSAHHRAAQVLFVSPWLQYDIGLCALCNFRCFSVFPGSKRMEAAEELQRAKCIPRREIK